ncbi:MAG TPA: PAS domain S-box protein, partial [Planctomycetota bacterium]|nr:PAS domain S-box protein [Planctomycetota bacterium]
MPRDPRGGSARSRRAAGGARSGPGPIQRLNEHLTRAFFDGRAELLREEEFDGDFRELARLANVFLRATRRAVDSARAAEGAVREREGRLALVLEASRDAIVAFDRSGRVLFANPAWVERSGFAPESVTRIPFELVAAEDRETFRAKVAAAFEGTPFRASYRAETRDGGERWISGQWSPLRDDKGTVAGIVGVERDDTQHREAEERHRTARRLESLGRLAGGIAHDFNNLLTVFSVQLDALRERLRDDPRARESLLPMEAAAARGADLVRQLLMFGRRAPADRSRVDLRTPLRETLDLLRRTVGDAYRIECEMPAEPLTVEGDRSQLAQVV